MLLRLLCLPKEDMMIEMLAILGCDPTDLSFNHEIYTESENQETPTERRPSLLSALGSTSPHVQIHVSGVDHITMQLSMYGGREVLERSCR